MQAVVNDAVPIFRRDDVPDRIEEIVQNHFRIARSSRSEIKQHRIFVLSRGFSDGPREFRRAFFHFVMEIDPTFAWRTNGHEFFYRRRIGKSLFDFALHRRIVIGNDHFDLRGIRAILDVLLQKLIGGRNGNRADSAQSHHCPPPFVAAAQNQHNRVSFFDSLGSQKIRGAF